MGDFSIDDIFNDPDFEGLAKDVEKKKGTVSLNPDIIKFEELNNWIKANGGEPTISRSNITERKLAKWLEALRKDFNRMESLQEYDYLNLLKLEPSELSLDEILDDDLLDEDDQLLASLTNMGRYKNTVHMADGLSQRKRMDKGFEKFREMFRKTQQEIADGRRRVIDYSGNRIRANAFYIDKGVLLYVERIYDPKTGQTYNETDGREFKVHTIYENQQENDIKLLSLVSSLYDKTRYGKIVTDLDDVDESLFTTTGYVYVVKYAGEHQDLRNINNLYKIGYTKNLKNRFNNTENESTYFYAPIELVATYEIQNLSASSVENYLHKVFANQRLIANIKLGNGKYVEAKEWFVVPLEEITDAVNKMVVELQQK
jgi:uncharacterized protein yeeC